VYMCTPSLVGQSQNTAGASLNCTTISTCIMKCIVACYAKFIAFTVQLFMTNEADVWVSDPAMPSEHATPHRLQANSS